MTKGVSANSLEEKETQMDRGGPDEEKDSNPCAQKKSRDPSIRQKDNNVSNVGGEKNKESKIGDGEKQPSHLRGGDEK